MFLRAAPHVGGVIVITSQSQHLKVDDQLFFITNSLEVEGVEGGGTPWEVVQRLPVNAGADPD